MSFRSFWGKRQPLLTSKIFVTLVEGPKDWGLTENEMKFQIVGGIFPMFSLGSDLFKVDGVLSIKYAKTTSIDNLSIVVAEEESEKFLEKVLEWKSIVTSDGVRYSFPSEYWGRILVETVTKQLEYVGVFPLSVSPLRYSAQVEIYYRTFVFSVNGVKVKERTVEEEPVEEPKVESTEEPTEEN